MRDVPLHTRIIPYHPSSREIQYIATTQTRQKRNGYSGQDPEFRNGQLTSIIINLPWISLESGQDSGHENPEFITAGPTNRPRKSS